MKLIIANWKMRVDLAKALKLAGSVIHFIEDKRLAVKLVLCPSFTEIEEVGKLLGQSGVELGAQDMFWEQKGAFTGEVSPEMLKEIGVKYVILGHSERRALGETDAEINKKIKAALKAELVPILCVGETLVERRAGKEKRVLARQLKIDLEGVAGFKQIIVAYEPVWAIGTGVPESPAEAVKMHAHIRKVLKSLYKKAERGIAIIYGGSVTAKNIGGFMRHEEIEGALVGGASTKAVEFKQILKVAAKYD